MTTFWRLLEESVIVQGTVTIGLIEAIIFLAVTEKQTPDGISSLALLTLGYYFGSKGQLTGKQAAKAVVQQLEGKE